MPEIIFGLMLWITIDLLAILRKSLDRALFLYNFIHEVRSSGVRGSIAIMQIRKFFKFHHKIIPFRFFPRIAKTSMEIQITWHFEKFIFSEIAVFREQVRLYCVSYIFNNLRLLCEIVYSDK